MRNDFHGPKIGRVLSKVFLICTMFVLAAIGAKSIFDGLVTRRIESAKAEAYKEAAAGCGQFVWSEAKRRGRLSLTSGEGGEKMVLIPESQPETQKGEVK